MSSDNYIYINKKTKEVWMCTASELVGTREKGLENLYQAGQIEQKIPPTDLFTMEFLKDIYSE